MRRLWLGLGCALLAGCADFFKPSDDREPLPVLSALDSAAIASMKISMGVWNGNVRDWIGAYSQSGRVRRLNVISSRNAGVVFSDTGLEYIEEVNFSVAADTLIIGGFSRFSLVSLLTFGGVNGYKMKVWPRGVYLNQNVESFSFGDGALSAVEDSLRFLKKLNFLDVAGNNIASLPAWMYEMQDLRIWIFRNRLCNLDSLQTDWLDKHATSWKYQNCP